MDSNFIEDTNSILPNDQKLDYNRTDHMTRTFMESMSFDDDPQYLDNPTLFNDASKFVSAEQEIKNSFLGSSNEEYQLSNQEEFQDWFNIQDNLTIDQSFNIESILETEIDECTSSTVDVETIEDEEASSSVNLNSYGLKLDNITKNQNTSVTIKDSTQSVISGENYNTDKKVNEKNIKNHRLSHGKGKNSSLKELYKKPHTCNLCGISFVLENAVFKHARINHIDDNAIVIIRRSTLNSNELTILSYSTTNNVTYSCEPCGLVLSRFDLYKLHQRKHFATRLESHDTTRKEKYEEAHKYVCIYCKSVLDSIGELNNHTKQHLVSRNMPEKSKCFICSEIFDNTDKLSNHVSQMHTDLLSKYSCKFCGKPFKSNQSLKKHLSITHPFANKCSICNKIFHHKASLKRHMGSHQEKTCLKCGIVVTDKEALIKHNKESHKKMVNVRNTKKIFPCKMCDRIFFSRSCHQIHTRVHTGERPFKCNYCSSTFLDGGSLKKHERVHTGERPYVCPICYKSYNQRIRVRCHLNSMHINKDRNINFHKCLVCKYLFQTPKELSSHLVAHVDKNTAKFRAMYIKSRQYTRRSKLINEKNTWRLEEKNSIVISSQSETENCEDNSTFTNNEQEIQSIMNINKLSQSELETSEDNSALNYKRQDVQSTMVDNNLSSKQMLNGSKNIRSKPKSKKQVIALKKNVGESTTKSKVLLVELQKEKCSNLGENKNTCRLSEENSIVLSNQSEAEISKDDSTSTYKGQDIQSTMDSYNLSSKPVLFKSKYGLRPKSEEHDIIPKKNKYSRACQTTVNYYHSKTITEDLTPPFGNKFKEYGNWEEHNNQKLTNNKSEFFENMDSNFIIDEYENICNIAYTDQDKIKYHLWNNNEFNLEEDKIMKVLNDKCLTETKLQLQLDSINEVGVNVEISNNTDKTEDLETISCDICDELLKDDKELMKHIRTMHLG